MNIIMEIRISAQRALLGAITPKMRQISIDFDHVKSEIIVYCYFDGEITEDDIDTIQCVGTEIISDFHADEARFIREEVIRHDIPQSLYKLDGIPIYRRKELI